MLLTAHKPTDGSSSLSPEDVIKIDECVGQMIAFYYGGIDDMFITYENCVSEDEEFKVAIYARLNSKIRSAIKFKIDSIKEN